MRAACCLDGNGGQTMGAILGCWCRRRLLKAVYLLDDQENRERDDQEVKNGVKEDAIIESWCPCRLGCGDAGIVFPGEIDKQIGKIHAAKGQTNRWHQDVLYKGCNYLPKRRTDHHGHG